MIRLSNVHDFPAASHGGVLCIGNFDGVHLGHTSMLTTGKTLALKHGRPFTIMTFDPHPMTLLRPNVPRVPLMTTPQRLEALSAIAPDILLVMPTTLELLKQSAEDFLSTTVAKTIGAKYIVEGSTFTYGRGAAGNVSTLLSQGPAFGIQTTIVPTAEQTLSDCTIVRVNSSTIRWLVQQGRMKDAAGCLGRPYTMRGTIVLGHQRGRGIGFPTANLQVTQLLPAPGVYAGRARIGNAAYAAAISVGDNPTFNGTAVTIEAYLLDYDGDLYGQTMDLEFHRWLREQFIYAGVDPLIRQLHRDVAQVRQLENL